MPIYAFKGTLVVTNDMATVWVRADSLDEAKDRIRSGEWEDHDEGSSGYEEFTWNREKPEET